MKTDSEFQKMLGELRADEERALRESIEREGVREPLTLWVKKTTCPDCQEIVAPIMNEYQDAVCTQCGMEFSKAQTTEILRDSVLVDGYNRCRLGMLFNKELSYRLVHFENRAEAKRWIAENQFGRRNISEAKRAYCLGLLYNTEKRDGVGRPEKERAPYYSKDTNKFAHSGQISGDTASKIAETHSVGRNTVVRAGEFAEAVDTVDAVIPGVKEKVFAGDISRRQVTDAAKEVKRGDTDAARDAIEKARIMRDELAAQIAEKKKQDMETLPISARAESLLKVCTLAEAVSALISALPETDRLREITETIKQLRDMSIEIQRKEDA